MAEVAAQVPAVLDGVGKVASTAGAVGNAVQSFKGSRGQSMSNKGDMLSSATGAIDKIGGLVMPEKNKNQISRDDGTGNILSAYEQYMKAFGGK